MSKETTNQVLIVTGLQSIVPPGRIERGLGDRLTAGLYAIDAKILNANMEQFIASLREVFSAPMNNIGGLAVSEVEISVQVTAEGKFCLLGNGANAGVQGGLKFVLKRPG